MQPISRTPRLLLERDRERERAREKGTIFVAFERRRRRASAVLRRGAIAGALAVGCCVLEVVRSWIFCTLRACVLRGGFDG